MGATLSARICCGSWPWGRYTKPTRKIEYENRSRENKLAIFYARLPFSFSPFVVVIFVVVRGGAAVVFSLCCLSWRFVFQLSFFYYAQRIICAAKLQFRSARHGGEMQGANGGNTEIQGKCIGNSPERLAAGMDQPNSFYKQLQWKNIAELAVTLFWFHAVVKDQQL